MFAVKKDKSQSGVSGLNSIKNVTCVVIIVIHVVVVFCVEKLYGVTDAEVLIGKIIAIVLHAHVVKNVQGPLVFAVQIVGKLILHMKMIFHGH